jgi:hypothetical protein
VTVADVIEHLKKLPPDTEVWTTWDESGEYWPATRLQGRIDWIAQVERFGKKRWEESDEPGKGKPVCVLLSALQAIPVSVEGPIHEIGDHSATAT